MIKVTMCPTAHCAPSWQTKPVSDDDVEALRAHALKRDAKSIAASARWAERGRIMSQYSPRTRRRP